MTTCHQNWLGAAGNPTIRLLSHAGKHTVAVDFDETIATKAKYPDAGEPYEWVAEALRTLMDMGLEVRIYTCRLNGKKMREGKEAYDADKRIVEDYLEKWGIPYDSIVPWSDGKPLACYYVDDKGVRFNGDWKATVELIRQFEALKARKKGQSS